MQNQKLGQSHSPVDLSFCHTFKSFPQHQPHSRTLCSSLLPWQWWLPTSLIERHASTVRQFIKPTGTELYQTMYVVCTQSGCLGNSSFIKPDSYFCLFLTANRIDNIILTQSSGQETQVIRCSAKVPKMSNVPFQKQFFGLGDKNWVSLSFALSISCESPQYG